MAATALVPAQAAQAATATLTTTSPDGNRPDNCEPAASITGCTG